MLILLDPAHGHNTPGKRSPDGTLLEYAYTRELANQILTTLQTKGHTLSDTLATCLYQSDRHTLKGKAIRTDYARDGDPDWEENFYILRHTLCPAVRIERCVLTLVSG